MVKQQLSPSQHKPHGLLLVPLNKSHWYQALCRLIAEKRLKAHILEKNTTTQKEIVEKHYQNKYTFKWIN